MSINTFTFSGNLGKDCVTKVTQKGKTIAKFSVACTSGFGDNKKTNWISCRILNDGFAQAMAPYLTKGKQVTVSGVYETAEWEKDGVKHSMPTCIVNDLELQRDSSQAPQQSYQQPVQQPVQQAPQQQPAQNQGQQPSGFNDFDDDIPF